MKCTCCKRRGYKLCYNSLITKYEEGKTGRREDRYASFGPNLVSHKEMDRRMTFGSELDQNSPLILSNVLSFHPMKLFPEAVDEK
jgi:hypothetical protein